MRSDSAAKIAETAVAAAIQAGVRSRLHGWAGHFGLTLPLMPGQAWKPVFAGLSTTAQDDRPHFGGRPVRAEGERNLSHFRLSGSNSSGRRADGREALASATVACTRVA